MEATMTAQEQISACLRFLAGQCDGAASKDGHGFNKFDAPLGHSLAMQARLARNQMIAAACMLKKYHDQLETAGLVVPTVAAAAKEPEATGEDSMEENMIVLTGQTATINDIEPIETKSTDIVLSAEQQALLDVMESTRQHLFITGRAGAGKSVLLRAFREQTKKRIVVAAPTGIAALNVSGQTLHSLFKLPPQLHRAGHRLDPNPRACSLLKRIDALVIDEISMVRADLLDAVDARLREAFRNDLPFGGIQIIMFGDVYQLPPVVDENLRDYFEAVHGGAFFFNALAWKQTEFKVYELTQVFRQKDPIFKDVLNAVRDGSVNDQQIEQLNARYGVALPADGAVTLAPTNNLVTQINQARLNRLPDKMYTYMASITGNMKRSVYPTEEHLELKKNAQIVLLKNDKDGRWVNGTVGKIEKLSDTGIEVNVGGIVHTLEKETWEEVAYTYDHSTQKVEAEVVSSFTQYPIRLAWALTIHKSQGQTYESVALDLTTATFAAGQLYVALSRATSLEGLYLKMPVKRSHIIVDPKVAAFMARRETIKVEVNEEAQAVVVEEFHSEIVSEPVIVEATIEEVTPEPTTAKTVLSLPTIKNRGGAGHKSDLVKKVNYKLSQDVADKFDALAKANPELNKSAFIDGLLAQWFEEHGL